MVAVDPRLSLWVLAATLLFVGAVALFLLRPSIAVALTIPIFAFLPTLKTLVSPDLGPTKDVVVFAAAAAAVAVYRFDRRRPDGWVMAAVAAELVLYAVNVGGGHDLAWTHGMRLTTEPLLLLLVGLTVRDAPRTLRFAVVSLVATSCVVAAYGVLQQIVGPWRLVGWGYEFGREVRTINGHLRSFGTLDEPFAYTAFLLFGLAAVMFWMRRRPLTYACSVLVLTGLATSLVRTAGLMASALAWLWLSSRGHGRVAAVAVAGVVAATIFVVVQQHGTEGHRVAGVDALLTLNGRTSEWKATMGKATDWPFGRGVGETGIAAARATYTISLGPASQNPLPAVDSGYLATVADVGLVGLAVLLSLFGRIVYLARRLLPSRAALLGLASLLVLMLDAVARSSFTGFPTAFLGLLLVGVAFAAADDEYRGQVATTAT